VSAIGFGALGGTAGTAATDAKINTLKDWDGFNIIEPFGCPDTTTYGEHITVPQGVTHLDKFTFAWANWINSMKNSGTMAVRAEVYVVGRDEGDRPVAVREEAHDLVPGQPVPSRDLHVGNRDRRDPGHQVRAVHQHRQGLREVHEELQARLGHRDQ
jgi:hypothetical protein